MPRLVCTGDVYTMNDSNGNEYRIIVTNHIGQAMSFTVGSIQNYWETYCYSVVHFSGTLLWRIGYIQNYLEDALTNKTWVYNINDRLLLGVVLQKLGRAAPASMQATATSNPSGAAITSTNPASVNPTPQPVLLPPAQVKTLPITFAIGVVPKFPIVATCKCPEDHPHNEKGCYYGMCSCRVKLAK